MSEETGEKHSHNPLVRYFNGPWLTVLGWIATGVMTAAAVAFVAGSF